MLAVSYDVALCAAAALSWIASASCVASGVVVSIYCCMACEIGRKLSHIDALILARAGGGAVTGARKSAVVAPLAQSSFLTIETTVHHAGPIGLVLVPQPGTDAVGVEAVRLPAHASLTGAVIRPGDILHAVNDNIVAFAGHAGVLAALAAAQARPLRLVFRRAVTSV